MKKFICLIGHPKRLTLISKCKIDDFENDYEKIKVYRCKYCGDYVGGYTKCIKANVKEINFDKVD